VVAGRLSALGYFDIMSDQICRGCGTPAPGGSGALVRWAVVDDAQHELYCPDCLSPREADALSAVADQAAEDQMLLQRLPDARTGIFVPEQRTPESLTSPRSGQLDALPSERP
jgi:hypothetical protein